MPEGGDFELAPAGLQLAICYSLVDVGWQKTTWSGTDKLQQKVALSFELCNETMDDGRPFMITAYLTNSLSEKAILRAHLEGWRGKAFTDKELAGFSLTNILGIACTLNIIHEENNGKHYANIKSISGVMKGTTVPNPHNALICYDNDAPDGDVFESLPKWLREKIENSVTVESATPGIEDLPEDDEFSDDIPF